MRGHNWGQHNYYAREELAVSEYIKAPARLASAGAHKGSEPPSPWEYSTIIKVACGHNAAPDTMRNNTFAPTYRCPLDQNESPEDQLPAVAIHHAVFLLT